jgi:lysophospholipase L1-like esterase
MEQNTFRTIVPFQPSKIQISHNEHLLLIGSCFSEHIAARLTANKFQVNKNPFGILYHPLAIANSLEEIIANKNYTEQDLVLHNELWQSWNHHSSFSGLDKKEVLLSINSQIESAHLHLKKAKHLVITLGSAWGYRIKTNGQLVANCHKFPNAHFNKTLITSEEITSRFTELIASLRTSNPSINVIFTISPVRHLRDGFRENQWSKSVLQIAVQQLQQKDNSLNYFPAYELIIDDLRDYRFYNDDMVHPNTLAIDYVWDRFCNTYFNQGTKDLNVQIDKLVSACAHRPFQPKSDAHHKFVKKQLELIKQLTKGKNYLDFDPELEKLQSQLIQ